MRLSRVGPFSIFFAAAVACGNGALSSGPDDSRGSDGGSDDAAAAMADHVAPVVSDGGADVDAALSDASPAFSPLCPKRPNAPAAASFKAPPPDANGTRVHARYLNTADGSRFLWTLHDQVYDEDC